MAKKPLILVAGGETLYIDLMEHLPRVVCQITYCETLGQVLDRAADADIVVVDIDFPGGAQELYRRLRVEPTTGQVPIILRAPITTGRDYADEVVQAGDLDRLVDAIRNKLPSRKSSESELSDEEFFDVESSTQVWRREGLDDSGSWPPPPPSLEGRDVLTFTRDYAGYVNSLVEAVAGAQPLSLSERQRLKLRAEQVLEGMDGVLDLTQRAVNDALRQKQLTRMREISGARNVLYEKLRQLRESTKNNVEPGGERPAPVAVKTGPLVDRNQEPELASPPPKESAISRAAREKEEQRKREAATRRAKVRRRRVTGSAKRTGTPSKKPHMLWIVVLCIGGAIAAAVVMRSRLSSQATATPQQNQQPYMNQVVLQQTPEAVNLLPLGTDPDGDRITFSVDWKINGRSVLSSNTKRLAARYYKEGDTVEADVTPNDGKTNGPPMISQPLRIISP